MVQEASKALWEAPFVCASHDAEDTFNYGNKAALALFDLTWEQFVGMKSTKSAEDEDDIQSERRELLAGGGRWKERSPSSRQESSRSLKGQ